MSEAKTVSGTTTNSTYAYPATSNRLASVTQGSTVARAFTSDAAGNITQDSRSGTAYAYTINDAGRIAQLKIGSTVSANYTYDFKSRLSVRQTLAMSLAGTTWSLPNEIWRIDAYKSCTMQQNYQAGTMHSSLLKDLFWATHNSRMTSGKQIGNKEA